MAMPIARAVQKSDNAKLGSGVSATYAAQVSCPQSCPFLDSGCYAETGTAGFTTHRLNRAAKVSKSGHLGVAKAEAAEINRLKDQGQLLRLHVLGDARTDEAAGILRDATKRFAGRTWSYTHAWREVKRRSWGGVSILASVESPADAKKAMGKGYAAAMVLPELPADGKKFNYGGVDVIPCPEMTKGIPCSSCKLCLKSDFLLKSRAVIGLAAHGGRKEVVKGVLFNVLG